jgi:energy-coupling factor transport system ATP-binding protein
MSRLGIISNKVSQISVNNLSWQYDGRSKNAISNISFKIEKGEFILILGSSGSGKSTLALCLNGLIPQEMPGKFSGEVRIEGLLTNKTSLSQLTQKVGVIFQDPESQIAMLKVEDDVAFGLENRITPLDEMNIRVKESLKSVGLLENKDDITSNLSGGMKQKLSLASMLASLPDILIFDEPTSNLDPKSSQDLYDLMHQFKKLEKYTILIIEHKLDGLMDIVDRVLLLNPNGTLLADGNPRDVLKKHISKIKEYGIWIPTVFWTGMKIKDKYKEQDIQIEQLPLTIDEAVNTFKPFIKSYSSKKEKKIRNKKIKKREYKKVNQLEIKNLSFAYTDEKYILKNISFSVDKGDFLAIVGPNGSGKTTLSKILIGILKATSGTAFLNGKDILSIDPIEISKKMGFVFQNPEHQFLSDTVFNEVALALRLTNKPEDFIEKRVNDILKQFELIEFKEKNPFSLSQGQKRRLSVATMLLWDQDILIFDEPTFGQDFKNSQQMWNILRDLNGIGKTIIVITHDMGFVSELTEKVILLFEGEIKFFGNTFDLFQKNKLLLNSNLIEPIPTTLARKLKISFKNKVFPTTVDEFLYLIN